MRMKRVSRKAIGVAVSTAALTGTVLAAATGSLPMQLQDSIHGLGAFGLSSSGSTNGGVNLPNPTFSGDASESSIFGLCTAYLNHTSGAPTTTSPTTTSSTTTSSTTPSSTTTTTGATVVIPPPPGVPEILAFLASVNNESVTQFCTSVNPKHAALKLEDKADHLTKTDNDDASTTSTTSTTVPSSTTTTSAARPGDRDDAGTTANAAGSGSNQQQNQGNKNLVNFSRGSFFSRTDSKTTISARSDSHNKSSSSDN